MNILWLATMTAVSLRFFFIVPTSFLVATMLIFVLAWWKLPAAERYNSTGNAAPAYRNRSDATLR